MADESGIVLDSETASFLERLEKVGYADTKVTRDFIVWVKNNIVCTVKNKNLKKDAELAFIIDGLQQFSLYHQILVNKMFFVVTQKNKYVKEMIDDTLVPLFEQTYRKKFIANNLRKKDQVFWIDIEQINDSGVFNEMTRIIAKGFTGSIPVAATDLHNTNEESAILPSREEFESACRMLNRTGEEISIDSVLDQLEINFDKKGILLKSNWRLESEKNIVIWSK